MKYRAEIDGLRALAVLPVIFFHAGFEWFSGGFVGVDIFFVISGYLITTIIISEMSEGRFSIVNFYERRGRRILPALFFMMAVCIPFALIWFAPSDLKIFGKSLLAVSAFVSNILFWKNTGYFESSAELNPLLHTWSLAVEEQYYILFPIFLMITWRFGIKWVLVILSVVFITSLGAAQWGAYNSPSFTFYMLPTRGWELLVGVFIAFYLNNKTYLKSKNLNQLLSLLGFCMVVYSIIHFDKSTPFPSLYALIPTIGTGLIILCAIPQTIIHKLLSLKLIVGVGLISYSTYLWHQPLLSFTRYKFFGEINDLITISLCLLSFVIGWLSWRFVEKPFRDKNRFKRKDIFCSFVLLTTVFCAIGLWFNQSDGRLSTYNKEDQSIFSSFINSASYVVQKHEEIRLRNFDLDSDQKKVLIIGDSHSQDLVNAVYEGGLTQNIQFSSYYIPVLCGVLFVDKKPDREPINFTCKEWRNFEDIFFKVASNADEIWIISDWQLLDVKYMHESIANLKKLNSSVLVFGAKGFGRIHASIYKNTPKSLWSALSYAAVARSNDNSIQNINNLLAVEVKSTESYFIDTQFLLCGDKEICPNYVDGRILSYDGSHLTPFGSAILGNKIRAKLAMIGPLD